MLHKDYCRSWREVITCSVVAPPGHRGRWRRETRPAPAGNYLFSARAASGLSSRAARSDMVRLRAAPRKYRLLSSECWLVRLHVLLVCLNVSARPLLVLREAPSGRRGVLTSEPREVSEPRSLSSSSAEQRAAAQAQTEPCGHRAQPWE